MSCVVQIAQPEPEFRSDFNPTILFHALRDALGSLITKRGWFGAWSLLALVCYLAAPLSAATTGTFGNFTYSDNGTYITITSYPSTATGAVEIPSTINGKPVTKIGANAFFSCTGLTSVSIPSSVTTIDSSAFSGCTGLTSMSIPASVSTIDSLAFFGCTGIFSFSVDAANPNYSSSDGVLFNKLQTSLINCPAGKSGTYTIPSSVATIGDRAFYACTGLTDVSIPSGVTTIGSFAFYGCTGLTGVALPPSIASIGSFAFFDCRRLTDMSIPSSVTSIGFNAFAGCTGIVSFSVDTANPNYSSLDDVLFNKPQTSLINCPARKSGAYTIPSSVTAIGDSAFNRCTELTSISIPSSVTIIGAYAFSACTGLTGVSIPSSVTTIGDSAFAECNGLTSISIPSGITSIGYGAFHRCTGLTSISIPSGVTTIGDQAFLECTGLTNVSIPPGVTAIGNYAFYGCSGLSSVSIPSGVTTIGSGAFSNCTALANVSIPSSVITIGNGAFSYCTDLTSVSIPSGVITIDGGAFSGCIGLTSVSIPSSVITIGDGTFSGCTGIVSFSVDAANPNYSSSDGVLFNKLQTSLIQCPEGKIGVYTIPLTVTTIGHDAFSGCTGLTSISFPSSLTTIGDSAFSGCTGLTNVSIPPVVTSIGSGAFYGCTGLTSMSIPSSVTSVGGSAFSGCTRIVSFSVDAANPNYSSSDSVLFNKLQTSLIQYPVGKSGAYTIPSGVITIGDAAFSGCIALTSVSIPSSVITIGGGAFSGCTSLTSVTIPPSVTTIGYHAFSECTGLTGVSIPSGVTTIGSGAFYGCTGIVSFSVAAANPSYSSSDGVLFNKLQTSLIQCPAGKSGVYTIPSGVISIGYSAFFGCSGLTSVLIPSGVITIDSNAFSGCTRLTSVSIPSSVTSIGGSAFYGCTGIVSFLVDAANPNYSSSDDVLFDKPQTSLIKFSAGKSGAYTIPSSVITIGSDAFSDCTGLSSVSISSGVTNIGVGAFARCTGLTGISIPASVTYIGDYAFFGCTGLVSFSVDAANRNYSSLDGVLFNKPQTSLIKFPAGKSGAYTIPADVTTIGFQAFFGCTGLVSLSVDAANPNYSSLDGVLFNKLQTLLIQYPAGKSGAYTIPASVTTIGIGAFYRCTGLVSLSVDAANPNYSSLDGVVFNKLQTSLIQCPAGRSGAYTIPSGVTSIGNYAFYGCTELTSVTFTENAPTLGSSVFDQTSSGFTLYYLSGSSGFTSPTWHGYPAQIILTQTITFGPLSDKTYGDAPFILSATASSGLIPTFSIVSGPATISGDTVTLTGAGTVTVRASQAGSAGYLAAATVDQSFIVLTALQSWRQTYFGTTANTGTAADSAVSNLDGLPNLLEYALGGIPTVANSNIPPKPGTVTSDEETYLTLTFTPQRSDISYTIEVSGDLTGAWTSTPLVGLLTMGQAYTYTDTVAVETGAPRFIRLRVSGQ